MASSAFCTWIKVQSSANTLQGLTDFLTFRGPDAQQIWVDGPVGFGHTLLKTAEESETEHQPFSLDGATWIVADARLDARADLIAKLGNQSQRGLAAAADVELLLRAYLAWGENCVDHLLGDFAFAIWDGPRENVCFALAIIWALSLSITPIRVRW